jgi:hypothetical protein
MPELSPGLPRGTPTTPRAGRVSKPAATLSAAEIAALVSEVALEIAAEVPEPKFGRRVPTTRHENPHLVHDPKDKQPRQYGMTKRAYGTALARFANAPVTESVARRHSGLDPRHPALKEGRTVHTAFVFDATQRDRVLISGINNAKLGRLVTKGLWAGSPIYHLSLEERKTCPRSCPVWDACYGNGMPAAVRFRYNANLMRSLPKELAALNERHPNGFVVRLHVLGDFPDLDYVKAWIDWSNRFRALQVEGYTAHARTSEIGQAICKMNLNRPKRWQIRNSVPMDAPCEPMQVSSLWDGANSVPDGIDGIVCPQELGKTQTCGTCALCWSPAMTDKRVFFLGHGGRGKK